MHRQSRKFEGRAPVYILIALKRAIRQAWRYSIIKFLKSFSASLGLEQCAGCWVFWMASIHYPPPVRGIHICHMYGLGIGSFEWETRYIPMLENDF